ncbi:MAG: ABC transporter ATP-binding protein, partial [Actinomycetia bacterium]|nr:ABC transporter ATP-binding protein [Actinomycetes bacterium]
MTATTSDFQSTANTPGEVVVEVTDLTAGYLPGVNILNDCNLVARQGELIGIIGPNG